MDTRSRHNQLAQFEMKSFVEDAAHELQTPLAILRGNVEILTRHCESEDTKRAVRVIETTLTRLSRLVDNLLDIAKFAMACETTIEDSLINVGELLNDAYEDCVVLAEYKHIALSVSTYGDKLREKVVVRGDRDKLKEVLLNLLSNALKYTPRGGRISLEATALSDGCVEITVEDTGIGIAPENKTRVFDRFYRINNDSKGVGLGLHISKQIIEASGGTLTLESEFGKGSRFIIRLPLVDTATDPPKGRVIINTCKPQP